VRGGERRNRKNDNKRVDVLRREIEKEGIPTQIRHCKERERRVPSLPTTSATTCNSIAEGKLWKGKCVHALSFCIEQGRGRK